MTEPGSERNEDLVHDGICPVCDEPFTDGFAEVEEGESYEGRICVTEKDADGNDGTMLVHLTGDEEDELPIRCGWEVGVQKRGDPDSWQFFHSRAKSESEARRRARSEARDQGWTDPEVYQITGPWRPNDPTQVGRELIEEVFGDV